ncbi:hypothetical protein RvY_04875-2 [Ramazzottius varieornatus]|uniref:Uncharacterized protein n=1 Tax=Ramazzottius varieornatus TaxID=947166 RepID=A0A1D1V312_RAMVA|nr:hypothetical protein RvY_04875-2 [Ramazzottius varieornatus]
MSSKAETVCSGRTHGKPGLFKWTTCFADLSFHGNLPAQAPLALSPNRLSDVQLCHDVFRTGVHLDAPWNRRYFKLYDNKQES